MNEYNVSEQKSGLDSVVPKDQGPQPSIQDRPNPESMVTKEPIDPLTKARIQYDEQRREVNAISRRLIESLESRISGPQDIFMAMAQGFGAPTRSGSFGESLSNALGGVSAVQKERRGIETDLAKMKLDLSSRELEQSKDNMLSGAISQLSGQGAPGGQGGMNLSPQASQMLRLASVLDPKSAITNLLKFTLDESKSAEAVKALNAYISMLPPDQQAGARDFAARSNVYGKPTEMVAAEKTILDLVAAQRISPEEGKERIASLRGQGGPSVAPSAPSTSANLPSANLQGNPQDIFAQIDQHPDPAKREEMKQAYIRQLSGQRPTQATQPFVPKTDVQIKLEQVAGEEGIKSKAASATDVYKKISDAYTAAESSATSAMSTINSMDQILRLSPNAASGQLQPMITGVKNVLTSLGISSDSLVNEQLIANAIDRTLIGKMEAMGSAARGLTDRDMISLKNSLPKLDTDKAAREEVARIVSKAKVFEIENYRMLRLNEAKNFPQQAAVRPVPSFYMQYIEMKGAANKLKNLVSSAKTEEEKLSHIKRFDNMYGAGVSEQILR
jgi:hypothetical protein